jgi:hypothetical protein
MPTFSQWWSGFKSPLFTAVPRCLPMAWYIVGTSAGRDPVAPKARLRRFAAGLKAPRTRSSASSRSPQPEVRGRVVADAAMVLLRRFCDAVGTLRMSVLEARGIGRARRSVTGTYRTVLEPTLRAVQGEGFPHAPRAPECGARPSASRPRLSVSGPIRARVQASDPSAPCEQRCAAGDGWPHLQRDDVETMTRHRCRSGHPSTPMPPSSSRPDRHHPASSAAVRGLRRLREQVHRARHDQTADDQ